MKEKRNKKRLLGFIFLFVAVATVIGVSVAYFSDFVAGSGKTTAGTLDLTKDTTVTELVHYNAAGTDLNDVHATNGIENFNPGDYAVITVKVDNDGNKSAWVRDILTVSGTMTSIAALGQEFANMVSIYEGIDYATATAAEKTAAKVTLTSNAYGGDELVINGSGTAAEVESATASNEFIGAATKTYTYTIVFEAAATNVYQGKTLDVALKVEALQYRNNATPTWTQVTATEFSL